MCSGSASCGLVDSRTLAVLAQKYILSSCVGLQHVVGCLLQASNINRSLLTLGSVIRALGEQQAVSNKSSYTQSMLLRLQSQYS
jgi:hypothetical protein